MRSPAWQARALAGQKGSWFVPPLPALKDRLQAIHTVLLPDGKVLMVNGSSNRNRIEKNGTIQDGVSSKDYDVVNNTALFDPSAARQFVRGRTDRIAPDAQFGRGQP